MTLAVGVTTALAMAAPAAQASHIRPNLGIQVTAVDPATRTVEAIQHCTAPERAGQPARFTVVEDIDFGQFQPGMLWGVAVEGDVIQSTGDMPCRIRPQGPLPPGPHPHGPGPDHVGGECRPDGPPCGPGPAGGEGPELARGFLNRVWKFNGEIDSYETGKLSITVSRILNLPKKFATQDDELVDEDAIVLVNSKVRIYDEKGKRLRQRALSDADESVRVAGKLLPPNKWEKDEDGQPVTTIRAKKIYLLG